MAESDIEKFPAARQDSETLASTNSDASSTEAHIEPPHQGPADILTPTVSHTSQPPLSQHFQSGASANLDPNYEVSWEDENDRQNPKNWPTWYKCLVLFGLSFSTVAVVAYSTSYTSGIPDMMKEFHVSSEPVATLGITTYLVGLAVGSLVVAPLSETFGRKPVYLAGMVFFTVMVAPAAKAKSMATVIIVRFFSAAGGAVMVSNAPGTISDISHPKYQALALSCWGIGPLNGPVIGPIIGGFSTQYLGWRWTDWIIMCAGAATIAVVALTRETYIPTILCRKAALKRKTTNDSRWWSRYEERVPFKKLLKINLSRPFIMAVTEPICVFWNIYVPVVYGILYFCFPAYPIVFAERGFSTAQSGLAFLGIGIGTSISIAMEPFIRRLINSHQPDPDTGTVPPEAAISVVFIGAFLIPIGELWFAWTCLPTSIHWAVPIAAGIPYGAGNALVFIYAVNYLALSYGIYAASALAGNAVIRSFLGGALPLAAPSMYSKMGPRWASTFCAILLILCIPIPFIFYRYGGRIRAKSALIRQMQEDRARNLRRSERMMKKLKTNEAADPQIIKETLDDKAAENPGDTTTNHGSGVEAKDLEPLADIKEAGLSEER